MFTKALDNDPTNPNKYNRFNKERYVEKKIVALIEKEHLTEEEHHILCLLTQVDMNNYPLICKDIWNKIPINYEEFIQQKSTIQFVIKERFSSVDAKFIYKTSRNNLIILPEDKMDNYSELLKRTLINHCLEKGYFNDLDLIQISLDNQYRIKLFGPKWRYLTPAERQQEQDASPNEQVGYWDNQEDYKRYEEAKKLDDEMYGVKSLIMCTRSILEFNDPVLFQKIELELSKEFLKLEEKTFGFELLKNPENTLTREEIQNKLDQFLLEETNLEKIENLVQKGANINAVGEHGMTILGVFLTKYIPNNNLDIAVPKLIDLGVDVNLGINQRSNKNTLMMALANDRPSISDETINNMIEISTIETINYAIPDGSALHFAIYRANRIDCVKKLINAGASLEIATSKGETPLIAAAANRHFHALKLILNYNAGTIDCQDQKGDTALMKALKCSGINDTIIDLLICTGANLELVNEDGKNAEQLASRNAYLNAQFKKSVEKGNALKISASGYGGLFHHNESNALDKCDNSATEGCQFDFTGQ